MSDEQIPLPSDAIAALERGNKIEAIKCVRLAKRIGLKEAKDAVERYLESNPDLHKRMQTHNVEGAMSGLAWLLLIIATAAAAYYFLGGTH